MNRTKEITVKVREWEPSGKAKTIRVRIQANPVGKYFATHRRLVEHGYGNEWELTHIPSGYAVCWHFYNESAAIKLGRYISRWGSV